MANCVIDDDIDEKLCQTFNPGRELATFDDKICEKTSKKTGRHLIDLLQVNQLSRLPAYSTHRLIAPRNKLQVKFLRSFKAKT